MVATIQITPYIHIQGTIARVLPNGQITIQQGGREYTGQPLRFQRHEGAAPLVHA